MGKALFKHFSKTFGHGSHESLNCIIAVTCKATASGDTVGQLNDTIRRRPDHQLNILNAIVLIVHGISKISFDTGQG
jgi:hypothetical protein